MPYLNDDLLDLALQNLEDNVENLYICSQEPATYAEAQTTYKLGTKAEPAFTGPANRSPNGRKTQIDAITDGTVNTTGTATHWALTDNSATKLLATGSLGASQAVTSGNTFTLSAFDIGIPDAT